VNEESKPKPPICHVCKATIEKRWPGGPIMMSAQEVAKVIRVVSAERIEELAAAGLLPHFQVEGKRLFTPSKVGQWIKANLTIRCEGSPLRDIVIAPSLEPPAPSHLLPDRLLGIEGLVRSFNFLISHPPCVYFLIEWPEVVYVGQSNRTLSSRIACHAQNEDRRFSRVVYLPVHPDELNRIEAAFIEHLRPKHNKTAQGYYGKPMYLTADEAASIVESVTDA